jgi:hypothetical protein
MVRNGSFKTFRADGRDAFADRHRDYRLEVDEKLKILSQADHQINLNSKWVFLTSRFGNLLLQKSLICYLKKTEIL